ncbi:MAG TPA: cytochrome d ubiquinol oxidase subunit II [Isosphaeraceae bacterium]|nr:cytochrome d ubiquinol oxidase subunit II [Isosphaeraceae bacterium]
METAWFSIVSAMLAIYVVLDGFDFGVGIVHHFVARTDQERRTVLSAIGPVWDGNEVWLIAAGGVLFMAFPRTYSTAFSGFYLALMIVLWLLILRGVAIEFRSHQENPLWREFWDTVFSLASMLLAVVFGTSLGNLVRGVPLGMYGLSGMPLFTKFVPGKEAGIFDWYTTLVGLFTLCALAGHGALYLVWRTTGLVQARSLTCALRMWRAVLPLWIAVTIATAWVQQEVFTNLFARPWSIAFVLPSLGGFCAVYYFLRHGRDLAAFLSSSVFLLGLIGATMIGNYPYWLRSTIDSSFSLSAANTISAGYGLRVALVWWIVGITLACGYFVYLYRSIRGKVEVEI